MSTRRWLRLLAVSFGAACAVHLAFWVIVYVTNAGSFSYQGDTATPIHVAPALAWLGRVVAFPVFLSPPRWLLVPWAAPYWMAVAWQAAIHLLFWTGATYAVLGGVAIFREHGYPTPS